MSLSLGELHGIIDLEDKGFAGGIDAAERAMSGLQGSTSRAMSSVEGTVTRSLDQIEQAIANGLDPASAIADLDRLEAELDASLREMEADADRFAAELDAAIDEAFDSLDDDARASGQRAGDELVDGLRGGLDGARDAARQAGDDAGRGLGDGVEETGRGRMSGVGGTLMTTLKGLGWAAAGAAIGQALMAGLESAMDAETARQKLFAQIGASEAEMGKLGRVAGQVYSSGYGEGLDDVTGALRSLIQNVDGVRDASEASLGTMSKRAMDVAAIMDEDVNRVTAAVGNILRNKLAPDAEAAFDVIVRGAQNGTNKSEDLLDTFVEYSTQFRELGLSAQDALGLMSQGLQAGARDADTVADALKEFAIRSKDGSDTSAAAFKAIGLDADKMFQVFSRGGEPAKRALGDVLDRIRDMKDPVAQDAVAVGLFGTKAEDLQDALLALDPSTAVASLGTLTGAAQQAGDTMHDTASNKIESWKRGLQTGVVDFIGGTVLPGLEKLAQGFSLSGALEAVQGWADQLGDIWDSIVADVQEWVSKNKETIDGWTQKFQEGFGSIGEIVDEVLTTIKELWDEYGDEIIVSVTFLVDTFLNIWNAFWGTVSGLFKAIKGMLTGDMSLLKEGLLKIWDSLWGLAKSTVETGLRAITGFMGQSWETARAKTIEAWERIKTGISNGIDNAVKFLKEFPGKVKGFFADIGTWLLQAGRDLIQGLIKGIQEMASRAAEAAKKVAEAATMAVKIQLGIHSPSKVFQELGRHTIQGWVNGVLAGQGAAVAAVKSVMAKARAAAAMDAGIGDPRAAMDAGVKKMLAKQKAAAEQKIGIQGATGNGGGGVPYQSANVTGTPGGVVVNMPGAVIREEADITRLAAQFGFEYSLRGAV